MHPATCTAPHFSVAPSREYRFLPRACHVRAAWEKGKIERSIAYLRQSFWPLRSFTDLADVNLQVHRWLEEVAQQRRHRETNQTPYERFQPEALRAVPAITPDYRDIAEALVHKDLRLCFDGNRYCVPPRYIGRYLTLKADSASVTIYDQHQEIISYTRCWQRAQVVGGERFQENCSPKSWRRSAQRLNSAWLSSSARPGQVPLLQEMSG